MVRRLQKKFPDQDKEVKEALTVGVTREEGTLH